ADDSKDDGTISKSRINTLLQELDEIEIEVNSEFSEELEQLVTKTAEQAEKNLTGVLIAMLGVAVVFGGRDKRPKASETINEIIDFVFNREIDGITLSDRVASVAGLLRDTMQREIRYGVYRGFSISQISSRIKDVFERTAWQF